MFIIANVLTSALLRTLVGPVDCEKNYTVDRGYMIPVSSLKPKRALPGDCLCRRECAGVPMRLFWW